MQQGCWLLRITVIDPPRDGLGLVREYQGSNDCLSRLVQAILFLLPNGLPKVAVKAVQRST